MAAAQRAIQESDALRERFASHGQDHVFRFWDALDAPARARLRSQAESLDLTALEVAARQLRAPSPAPAGDPVPPAVERLPEHGGDPARRAGLRERGEARLRAARVAPLLLAGGQGTRLGFSGPKGAFPLGPLGSRSLFALHAERIRGLRRRAGRPIPWVVMTSAATDAATRELFAREQGFGIPADDLLLFRQADAPALDADGRLLLEAPDRIAVCPDGHGGVFGALEASGVAATLAERGVESVSTYQVDNPLAPPLDPLYLGLHDEAGAEMSCKVLAKQRPDERVGTPVLRDGALHMVEYTELPLETGAAHGADGSLRFWAGSIGMHLIELSLGTRIAAATARWLPFHASRKAIPCLDTAGRRLEPEIPNAFKLERFVFDALPACRASALLEVRRGEEYTPVKNARGGESPENARRALDAHYRRLLEAAGVPAPPPGRAFELDHAALELPAGVPFDPHLLRSDGAPR